MPVLTNVILLTGLMIGLLINWPSRSRLKKTKHPIKWGSPGPIIWFSLGEDPGYVILHIDFPKMLEEPSLWPTGLANIDIVQFSASYLLEDPVQSLGYVNLLREHCVAIAVMMTLAEMNLYPSLIKEIGIDLDYVVLDEPFSRIVECVVIVRRFHPKAAIILVVPDRVLTPGPQVLANFLDAYREALHEYPVAVRFSGEGGRGRKKELSSFIGMLKSRNIGYGMTYDFGTDHLV
jgi:hypothetical protein